MQTLNTQTCTQTEHIFLVEVFYWESWALHVTARKLDTGEWTQMRKPLRDAECMSEANRV